MLLQGKVFFKGFKQFSQRELDSASKVAERYASKLGFSRFQAVELFVKKIHTQRRFQVKAKLLTRRQVLHASSIDTSLARGVDSSLRKLLEQARH